MLATAAATIGFLGLPYARQIANKKLVPVANAKLGVNLAGIVDWSTEFALVDLFKQSRAWYVEGKDTSDSGLTLDADGWVTQLPLGSKASTIISSLDNSHFPNGDYMILYEGEGDISVPNHLKKSAKAGQIMVNIDATKNLFRLDITKTNPYNYIKNIRVVPAAQVHSYQQNRWSAHFLARWKGIACLRFMDVMQTNNSLQTNWQNRPKPTDASFTSKGVPVEWLIDLANQLHCDAWFCMPHMADDDYIKQFATMVKANLKPNLKVYIEYSNEVWNGSFAQQIYASQQGLRLQLSSQPSEAGWRYTALRSTQIFSIWATVFGGAQQLVRVLATQAVYDEVAKQILGFKLPNGKVAADDADVLAVANYVGLSVSHSLENGLNDTIVADWHLDKLFKHLNEIELPDRQNSMVANKKMADDYGLKLVAYEAGQHLTGYAGAQDNDKLTALFLQANADARMGMLYSKSLGLWQQIGGDLMCAYNSIGLWSKWGSWGLLQYDDVKPTPKFKAVIDWANARGQKMRL